MLFDIILFVWGVFLIGLGFISFVWNVIHYFDKKTVVRKIIEVPENFLMIDQKRWLELLKGRDDLTVYEEYRLMLSDPESEVNQCLKSMRHFRSVSHEIQEDQN